jgi:hypothetical protein
MEGGLSFEYLEEDDAYELTIVAGEQTALVDGELYHNNALGDLIRAATATATGQWNADMWHGSGNDLSRVRFTLWPVSSELPGDRQYGVRIQVHRARSAVDLIEPPVLDAVVKPPLAVARAVHRSTAPHISDFWSDDLAHKVLGLTIALLESLNRVGPARSL